MAKMMLGYKPNQFTAPDIFKYDLSHYAKLTYVFLQRYLVVEGEVAPSKNEIAYYIDCSKRKVDDSIKELEECGLVKIISRKKGPKENDTNLYIIYHPEQINELKLLPPYEEVKYSKKKKKKGSAGDAPPKNLVHEMHYPEKSSAGDAPPNGNLSNDAASDENLMQEMQGSNSLRLDLDRLEDEPLSDEEIVKIAYRKYFKEELSISQVEKFIEAAWENQLTIEDVLEEMKHIFENVTIKTTPDATLYSSLIAGGWLKKKKLAKEAKQAEQKEQKPKRKLLRRSQLPKSVQKQLEQQQGDKQAEEPKKQMTDEELSEKQARIQEKLKLMREKLSARKQKLSEEEKVGV